MAEERITTLSPEQWIEHDLNAGAYDVEQDVAVRYLSDHLEIRTTAEKVLGDRRDVESVEILWDDFSVRYWRDTSGNYRITYSE